MSGLSQLIPEGIKVYGRTMRAWALSRDLEPDDVGPLDPGEISASAEISVVVPVHDAPAVTARCLESLERFGGEAEIIIVDDGSKQAVTRELLAKSCGRNGWTLISNAKGPQPCV